MKKLKYKLFFKTQFENPKSFFILKIYFELSI